MIKISMRKKGELSTTWIVSIILLLVGFVIISVFFYKFLFQDTIDKEVCHQSVILRGTAATLAVELEDYVPIKCKTAKYCVTTRSGKNLCPDMQNEKGVTNIKVTNKEQIEKLLVQELLSCWKMMGEGKVSLFTQYFASTYGIGNVYPTCVVCSRVAYDYDSLEKAKIDLKAINMLAYMNKYRVPGTDKSYFRTLAGDGGQFKIPDQFYVLEENSKNTELTSEEKAKLDFDGLTKTGGEIKAVENLEEKIGIYRNTTAIMFMQITAPGHWQAAKNVFGKVAVLGGVAVAGGTYVVAKGTFVVGVTKMLSLAKGAATAVVSLPALAITAGVALILGATWEYNIASNRAVTAGYCGDVSTGGKARSGCSVVRTVNYNLEQINQYCREIEGIA